MDVPEEIVVNIITRLPLQSIYRFRAVCREWKSLTESAFFRDLYHSNSNSTSCNWSILLGNNSNSVIHSSLEEVKLDLPSPHGNNPSFPFVFTPKDNKIKEIRIVACTDGLVLLRLHEEDMMIRRYYLGNPLLPQWNWIQLPLPPSFRNTFCDWGLVTRMHSNGAILGYKVVRVHNPSQSAFFFSRTWSFEIFSSDTGEWSVTQVSFPVLLSVSMLNTSSSISLNGKLHWLDYYGSMIVVHDLFSHDDDQVRAISLPDNLQIRPDICASTFRKIICTNSQGYFVLIDAELKKEVNSYNVRAWRLKSDSWSWEKAWEINMASVGLGPSCVPMAVNCFDIDVIYLWDLESKCFIACNLRTLTKSYGARKVGTQIDSIFPKTRKTVYKEDTLCSKERSFLSNFVPSLQALPTYETQDDIYI